MSTVAFLIFGPLFAARPMLAALAAVAAVGVGHTLLGEANGTQVPVWGYAVLAVLAVAETVLGWVRDWLSDLPSTWRAGFHALAAGLCAASLLMPFSVADAVPIALAASAAFLCGRQWSAFRGDLLGLDPSGILRLPLIVAALEVVWTLAIAVITAGYPRIALAVVAMSAVTLVIGAGVSRLWEKRAETGCDTCGKAVHACALVCWYCGAKRAASRAGWSGRPGKLPPRSVEHQRMSLMAAGRCARCAMPAGSGLLSVCGKCGEAHLTRDEAEQFLQAVDRRLPVTLAICTAFSAVPLFGLVGGAIYFRLSRNGSLRRYVPWYRKLFTRLALTAATLGLALLQPVPFIGIVSVPAICLLNYAADRLAARAQLRAAAPVQTEEVPSASAVEPERAA